MRHARFFDWLDESTDGRVGQVLKTALAWALLLSLGLLGYRFVRDYRAELRATNARLEAGLHK